VRLCLCCHTRRYEAARVFGFCAAQRSGFRLDMRPGFNGGDLLCGRTGTWSSRAGDGVLGEGYGSPGVPRKLMNSFGTLTHGSSAGLSGNGGPVLGSGGRGAGTTPTRPSVTLTKGGNGTLKSPRPNKARVAIEALTVGLQGCIRSAEEEMETLKSSITDLSIHSNQVISKFHPFLFKHTIS